MAFRQRLLNILKVIIGKRVTWYMLGIATIPIIVFILIMIGVKPSASEADKLISKWNIFEQEDGRLLLHITGNDNICFIVGVECNPENGLLEEISVTNGRSEHCAFRSGFDQNHENHLLDSNDIPGSDTAAVVFPCFVYRTKGRYGVPIAAYGIVDHGILWSDFNANSIFDQKIDYRNRTMMINVEGRLVKGAGKDQVVTDEGVYKFNVSSGKWEIVDPNASLK